MLRIAHIADIHFKNHSRHDEYRKVFLEFAKQCKDQQVDHIFVGGDLFHTKTSGMSPECIDLMCWWFTLLTEVAEVHVTLGNHDFNMMNLTRQDAVSPIVAALNNPRLHLYKNSGVYEFAPGYNWCVFSLFDEEGWANVKPVPGMINITCYHGPVSGALTETNWSVDGGVSVDFFKDYEFCFLGDIHKLQYLGFRDVELVIDSADLAKYPGAEILEEIE